MKCLALILPFLAIPAAAGAEDDPLPTEMKLAEPAALAQDPQDREEQRQQPAEGSMPVMEYVYRYSEFEAGVLFTDWGGALKLDPRLGFYARYGVGLTKVLSVNLTYRHYDYDNTEIPASEDERVVIRGLLAGVGGHIPITPEFSFVGNASIGAIRLETHLPGQSTDTAFVFSGEAGLTVRLHEVLRLKAGLVLDVIHTDFHRTSADASVSLSYLVGLEIGGW